jgi:hypothetical protein
MIELQHVRTGISQLLYDGDGLAQSGELNQIHEYDSPCKLIR